MTNHLLTWDEKSPDTWHRLRERAVTYGARGATWTEEARGLSIGLIFFNSSLRTRTSMELAAHQLGAHATTLVPGQGTWGFAWEDGAVMDGESAEHIREAVGVLSRYYDGLGVRVFATQEDYEQDRAEVLLNRFAEAADVPVVNMESAFHHPCQALGDAATLRTQFDAPLTGRRFVLSWAPHPKALPMAVPHSAVLMAAREGMDVTVARPDGFSLDADVMDRARSTARREGGSVRETSDQAAAFDDAHVVYAKSWAGQAVYSGPEREARLRAANADWTITDALMDRTDEGVFMHCLPVRRNVVVEDAVLDGPRAIHLDQAEFRIHAQKAILEHLWELRP